MNAPHNKGNGATIQWLRKHVSYRGANCLIWPFCRQPTGYGALRFEGRAYYAHRIMCELANGLQPSPEYEAAHSCGPGKSGCVHPRHLSWKTRSNNQLDRHVHGTITAGNRWKPKLNAKKVADIRAMRGKKTQRELAAKYGVTFQTISSVQRGKHWN